MTGPDPIDTALHCSRSRRTSLEVTLKSLRWAIPAFLIVAGAVAPSFAQSVKPTTTRPRPAAGTPASRPAAAARRAPLNGSPDRLDGIAAVVDNDVVLQSDVEEQLYLFLLRNKVQNPDSVMVDTLRRQILDQLVTEKLIVSEAKRQSITVSDAEVNREVEKAIRDARERLGPDAFQAQLQKENLTEEKLRAKYKDEAQRTLLAQRLVAKELPQKKTAIPAAEAEAYFKAHPDEFPKAPAEVRLAVIQIPALPDSATDLAAKNKALVARKRILAGEKFAKVAADVSDDPNSARSGGDLGFIIRGSFEPALEGPAFILKPGELSQPIHSPYGWHLLEVLERDTVKTIAGKDSLDEAGKPVPEAHVRHIMIRVELSDADAARARTLADRVRGEARKGTDFATLVRRYSKYEGKVGEGGDLGFVSMNTLQPNIRAGLDSLEIGEASDVLVNQVGFNIFKVTDRKPERAFTLEEIKDELPGAVQQIQYRRQYDQWIGSLRKKSHVEIR
jgi:peptidyl-prolyl cis-trans isomerase SurA